MAGQADGTIIVDTELNSEGFKAGSAELQRAVKSLSGKINNLGPTLHKALSGGESAITSFNAKTAALEDTIAELETKMDALGNATFETADYQSLCAEIDAVSQKLDQLTARVYPKFCVNSNKWRKIGRNNIFGVVALTPPLGYSINRKLHACQGQRLSGRCSFYP